MNNEEKILELMEKMYIGLSGKMEKIYADFNDRFENIENEVKENTSHIQDLKNRVKENANHIQNLEMKIKNEISGKTHRLCDNREVANNKLDNINEKVDMLQMNINNLSTKVTQNYNQIIELKINLKNIK